MENKRFAERVNVIYVLWVKPYGRSAYNVAGFNSKEDAEEYYKQYSSVHNDIEDHWEEKMLYFS